MTKRILMIAGPNGAGKTTTAQSLLTTHTIYEYLNADEIARGLAPLHPESVSLTASKLMISRIKCLLSLNKSFAFETTAAGKNYLKHLQEAKKIGYEIDLLFLWLSSADLAVKRVAHRKAQGGHHIPEDTIRRRYKLGLKNVISVYLPIADNAIIMNNSLQDTSITVMKKNRENGMIILEPHIWDAIQRFANE